jgi:hypothetical protein
LGSAERTRRYRERQRRGECVISIPLSQDDVENLRAHGFLGQWSEGGPEELATAAFACLRYALALSAPTADLVTRHNLPSEKLVEQPSKGRMAAKTEA